MIVSERNMGFSMKKALAVLSALAAALALMLGVAGCGGQDASGLTTSTSQTAPAAGDSSATSESESQAATTFSDALTVIYDDEDLDDSWDESSASFISLADGSIRFDGAGATASGDKVTITSAGTYVISGATTDGQIVVDLEEKGVAKLVLNGADITCSTSAPIYIKNSTRTIITLAEGTENQVTDGSSYVLEDTESDEPDAAVFSKDDLTINGTGSLTVTGSYQGGIRCQDQLKIVSGSITVDAVGDAIRGRDCIGIKDGTITVTAGDDGLQSNNDEDAAKGYIDIQGGTIDITADNDGIQAQTTLLVAGGDLTLVTGGGSANAETQTNGGWGGGQGQASATADDATTEDESTSMKGLKAEGGVFVAGGTLSADCADDSIHSNNLVQIDGGNLTLASGDDGIHADATVEINAGDISITQSYEGVEGAVITINEGTVRAQASDDGINVAGGNDESAANGPMGQDAFTVNENNQLYINGGYVAIDASGDGIDCNGRVFMTAGTVILNGPTNDGNGAIDYLGEFTISGGYLVAAGSSGMAEAPSESSTQYSVMVNFDTVQEAGALIHIQDDDGAEILTFAPTKQYQSLVLSSPEIREAATYTVYVGGSSTGIATDSLYSDGTYTPGTEYAALTISGIVTALGAFGGMMGGGMLGGDGRSRGDAQRTPPSGVQGGGTMPNGGTDGRSAP